MRYLTLALLALGLVACDDSSGDETCLTSGCPASHECTNVGEEADDIDYICVEISCARIGCFDDEQVCKHLGEGEYACVTPLPLGAPCEDGAQCEDFCIRRAFDDPRPALCSTSCDDFGQGCPEGFSCDGGETNKFCIPAQ